MIPIPKNVKIALALHLGWTFVELITWSLLNVKDSDYYSWGPSDRFSLPFTGTIIDTWPKWGGLMIHTTFSVGINVFCADMFYPWMSSAALNPAVKLKHDKFHTWVAVNAFWTLTGVNSLLFFMLSFSQIDVAVNSTLTAFIVGAYSSRRAIYDKQREADSSEDNQDLELNNQSLL